MRIADIGITEEAGGIAVDGVTDFIPAHVFGNGQSFRWKQERDSSYTGIVQGKVANINYVITLMTGIRGCQSSIDL